MELTHGVDVHIEDVHMARVWHMALVWHMEDVAYKFFTCYEFHV